MVSKKLFLASVLAVSSVSALALDIKANDAIAFMGDRVVANAESKDIGFGKLVTSGLKAMGVETTNLNWGLKDESAFESTYETLPGHLESESPNWVIVSYGIDDVKKGMTFSGANSFCWALTNIVEQIRAKGATPVFMTTSTDTADNLSSANNATLVKYNAAIKAIAASLGLKCYDFNAEMLAYLAEHPETSKARVLTTDGTLLNWRGGMMAAKGILKTLGASDAQLAQAQAAWDQISDVVSVTIPMSFTEFYKIVENAKNDGYYTGKKTLPGVRKWMREHIASGTAVPDVAIPAPVILDDTTVRPTYATREYKSGETIFLLGDSITQLAGNYQFGYDKLLKKGLEVWGKTDVVVENHGRSGTTTRWMRSEAQKPTWDWIFLEAGINDANYERYYDAYVTNYVVGTVTTLDSYINPENHPTSAKVADFCANVTDITRKSKAAGAQVILATTTCNGEDPRSTWFPRHEPSWYEHNCYNPMYRDIAAAEKVPLIDFWKYWMGGPYYGSGTKEYTGFIETNKTDSAERLMEGVSSVFLTHDNTHLYFQGFRDVARRLLTVMGCPASKMPEIENAWWNMEGAYSVDLSLSLSEYARVEAGVAETGLSAGDYTHDRILFPSSTPTPEPTVSGHYKWKGGASGKWNSSSNWSE